MVLAAAGTGAWALRSADGPLKMDPTASKTNRLGYFPVQLKFAASKPAGITKEPSYRATPKYAVLKLGNGPKASYIIAVDEPENEDWKIYIDKNRNGDLTDDGDGAWAGKRVNNDRTMYGVNEVVLKASYGTAENETASVDYGVAFYRFSGQDYLLMYRTGGRTGEVMVDGKPVKTLLLENDVDGIFSKPLDDDGKPVNGGAPGRPVWLLMDLDGDGKFDMQKEMNDARLPFKIGDKSFEARISADGSSLQLTPTTRKVAEKPKPVERPALLAAGTVAPDFTVEAYGGGSVKLSDFRGKVVVLDFWATWCGPCLASFPHLQEVWKEVESKGVVVLAVCTSDMRDKYEKWVAENKGKYTWKFAFDPNGLTANSISRSLYKVSGIPTKYIIDKEGKIVESQVGYSGADDKRLEAALKKLGVDVAAAAK